MLACYRYNVHSNNSLYYDLKLPVNKPCVGSVWSTIQCVKPQELKQHGVS